MRRICCLPVAGRENPYQFLMMEGLREDKSLEVFSGYNGKFIGILLSVLIHRPDYIHFDWIHRYYIRRKRLVTLLALPLFIFQLFVIRRILKVKIVWTLHNIYPHDHESNKVERYVRSLFAKECDWIRVFSDSLVDDVVSEFGINDEKIKVRPEGSYAAYYENNVDVRKARKHFDIGLSERVFLFIGRIRLYKGIDTLIKVFKDVREANWRLLIAGECSDPDYRRYLESETSSIDFITLDIRHIPDDDLQYYFNAADIVVLPFTSVTNSGSIILAMDYAKPVIAPSLGVIPDRLSKQRELLYEKDMKDSFDIVRHYSDKRLKEIGLLNRDSLSKYSWIDFASDFS